MTPTSTPTEADLLDLADAASDGPWTVGVSDGEAWPVDTASGSLTWDDHGGAVFTRPDAEFIAAARVAIPELVHKVTSQSAVIRTVLALHAPIDWDFGSGGVLVCRECVRLGGPETEAAFPCPTVRALGQWATA